MKDPLSLGLVVRNIKPVQEGEVRAEMRLSSVNAMVAWFQSDERESDGVRVKSTNTQLVRRKELTPEQIAVAEAWLRELVLEHL